MIFKLEQTVLGLETHSKSLSLFLTVSHELLLLRIDMIVFMFKVHNGFIVHNELGKQMHMGRIFI